jgi:SOS-response transcriptional repressor LexA
METLGYLLLPNMPGEGFALFQRGDYMAPTIQAHDLVIFESAGSINNEDLVLVKNKWGTWLIRRFRKANGKIMLTTDNPAYRAFEYDPDEQKIAAKVSTVMRNVNF